MPLGVGVIDASIELFGQLFPFIVNKHRGQLMDHFNECISKNKGPRQQAIQVNIFTGFLAALKVCFLYNLIKIQQLHNYKRLQKTITKNDYKKRLQKTITKNDYKKRCHKESRNTFQPCDH